MSKNVHSIITDLQSGLEDLAAHFQHLRSVFGGEKTASGGRKASARGRKKSIARVKKTRKKMSMSPALRKQRQMQGRYMGMIRRLPKAKQAQLKKVRETKGYAAALKMMG